MRCFKNLLAQRNGNVAMIFALIAPLLIGVVGAGVDYAQYNRFKSELQAIADSAAIAGARAYAISGTNKKIPKNVAENLVTRKLKLGKGMATAKSEAVANDQENTVRVDIKHSFVPSFLTAIIENPIKVEVTSQAESVGSANICVIALSDNKKDAILLNQNASLVGNDCAIYSNSTHNNGISASGNASVSTVLNCSAGGYEGNALAFTPAVITDCPPREDPLATLPVPVSGPCSPVLNGVSDITTTLNPGVYCGGLTIGGTANVTLSPGIYIFKESDLTVSGSATIQGEDVTLFFEGNGASLFFDENTTIDLSGPENGNLAGVLIYQDRFANGSGDFVVRSNNAHTLVGTIYLPVGDFIIDASAPVAASSEYTAIIADEVEILNASALVLNSDYAATDVPVPEGLAGANGVVRLRN